MTADVRNWSDTKRRIQERWPGLSADEVDASQGDREALVGLLQGRLGYARSNAEQDVDEILGGETIVPEDVADESTHTGTSGPVGPVSAATDFTGDTNRAPNGGQAELPNQPSEATSAPLPDAGTFTGTTASSAEPGDEPAELPNQPSEATSAPRPTPMTPGAGMTAAEGGAGGGQPPAGDRDRWGRDPWESPMPGGESGKGAAMPKLIVTIVGVGGALLVLGMMLRKRRTKKRGRAEQVSEQARHLLEDINERMPSVEEFREKLRSLEELRGKREMRSKRDERPRKMRVAFLARRS